MMTPNEILSVLDQAQKRLGKEFDMRALLWEIIDDVLDSVYLACDGQGPIPAIVEDYVANHYGDDR